MNNATKWKIAVLAFAILTPTAFYMYTGQNVFSGLLSDVIDLGKYAPLTITSPNLTRSIVIENNAVMSGEVQVQEINLYTVGVKSAITTTFDEVKILTSIPENHAKFESFTLTSPDQADKTYSCAPEKNTDTEGNIIVESLLCTPSQGAFTFAPEESYKLTLVGKLASIDSNWFGKIYGVAREGILYNTDQIDINNKSRQRRLKFRTSTYVTESFRKASWKCHNGEESNFSHLETCATQKQWTDYADFTCHEKCSISTAKCGVDTFSPGELCPATTSSVAE